MHRQMPPLTWCLRTGGGGAGVRGVAGGLGAGAAEAGVPVLAANLPGTAGRLHAGEVPHAAGPDVRGVQDLRESDHSPVQLHIPETALEGFTRGLHTLSITKLSTICSLPFPKRKRKTII